MSSYASSELDVRGAWVVCELAAAWFAAAATADEAAVLKRAILLGDVFLGCSKNLRLTEVMVIYRKVKFTDVFLNIAKQTPTAYHITLSNRLAKNCKLKPGLDVEE